MNLATATYSFEAVSCAFRSGIWRSVSCYLAYIGRQHRFSSSSSPYATISDTLIQPGLGGANRSLTTAWSWPNTTPSTEAVFNLEVATSATRQPGAKPG
jgi:hypothetical protein